MIAYPIPDNVGKPHIHFGYVYGSGNLGMAGLKFFDQAGNLLLAVGQVIYTQRNRAFSHLMDFWRFLAEKIEDIQTT